MSESFEVACDPLALGRGLDKNTRYCFSPLASLSNRVKTSLVAAWPRAFRRTPSSLNSRRSAPITLMLAVQRWPLAAGVNKKEVAGFAAAGDPFRPGSARSEVWAGQPAPPRR